MRSRRRENTGFVIGRPWLFGAVILLALISVTVNCTLANDQASPTLASQKSGSEPDYGLSVMQVSEQPLSEPVVASKQKYLFSEEMWAEVTDTSQTTLPTHSSSDRISLNVKDANLLDVLSMLAYKLDANVIFLEEPTLITIKTEMLSPSTTFQIVLQKAGLDYLPIGRNFIVGERNRLYDDFTNRMFLTRYNLFYVSASSMFTYIDELGMPLQALAVDSNQKAIWMQGTPMTLGKARELINTLDVMENAEFAVGGARKIRMPVAEARGPRAEEELEALIDLLSILLDGFRDGRTEMGWVTWDHPDPVPAIYMDWENPIIKPHDIKMKITRDFANDYNNQIRYLIAEGNPDNIELVNQMIVAIRETEASPLGLSSLGEEPIPIPSGGNTIVQWTPPPQQQTSPIPTYSISVIAVPVEGGKLDGDGSYKEGSLVTITAVPAEGYNFVRWIEGGVEISTSVSHTFTIYNNRNFEAVFLSNSTNSEPDSAAVKPADE